MPGKLKQPTSMEGLTPVPQPLPRPPLNTPSADPEFSSIALAPIPPVMGTPVDASRQFYRQSVSQIRMPPLPALSNIAQGSQIASHVAPVAETANAASTTANNANTTANEASATATVAATGVTAINASTAVGVVSGVLKQVPISTLDAITLTPTLDALTDGATYNRVLATAITSGAIDSTKPGFLAEGGSTVPQIVGGTASLFTYTATASTHTVVISWAGFTVYFANTVAGSVAISSGSQTITSVSTGTYYFYAYLNASNVVQFVAVSGGSGSPAILYAPQSPTAAQQINLQSVTALSNGGIQVVMPSSGGGSGGGGGSQLCARADQFVRTRERGVIRLKDCKVGDEIDSRHGYTEIKNLRFVKQSTFIKFTIHRDETLSVTPTHHLTVMRQGVEESVDAARVNLMDTLYHVDGYATIRKIEIVENPTAEKAIIHLEPTHEYWCGEIAPTISAANAVPIS